MDSTHVLVQLYPGFAVIKGTYFLKNLTSDSLKTTGGFPYDSDFNSGGGYFVLRTSYTKNYFLRVFENGVEDSLYKSEHWYSPEHEEANSWYLWENILLPDTITRIEIYTIVSTNNSSMTNDWSDNDDNVFVYVTESGMWNSPIRSGSITIQLMEGLDADQLRGFAPDSLFTINADKNLLHCSFSDLKTNDGSKNIVIAYGQHLTDFDFDKIVSNQEKYCKAIDQLELMKTETANQIFLSDNPFQFGTLFDDSILMAFLVFVLLVVGFIITVIVWNKKPILR